MRAAAILGFDPVPGDPARLVVLSDVLRRAMRGLVEARLALDRLGRTGSVWDGVAGAPIATVLRTYSRRLSVLCRCASRCAGRSMAKLGNRGVRINAKTPRRQDATALPVLGGEFVVAVHAGCRAYLSRWCARQGSCALIPP